MESVYPPTPAAQGGTRQEKRVSDYHHHDHHYYSYYSYSYFYSCWLAARCGKQLEKTKLSVLIRFQKGWRCFAVSEAVTKAYSLCFGAGWLQDVASSWKKLKTVSFNRVSERTLGIFGDSFCNLSAGNQVAFCRFGGGHKGIQPVLWAGWLQDVASSWKKLKNCLL